MMGMKRERVNGGGRLRHDVRLLALQHCSVFSGICRGGGSGRAVRRNCSFFGSEEKRRSIKRIRGFFCVDGKLPIE